ncbi:chemotaxis protein CheA [Candidatus Nitrosotenuis uzonensis]|uniref:Chemotaxis protein CheA n=1 Tax=Candidatus Nitrosotenuis uzonensis TaxID=1407055 RepID=V6AQA7_9ARCH|nr:chemotaxis protein CheA [Candidatus Nitrosotenuis uzonensis]CDI04906.1 putative chemotaxis histidine kinase related protein [Candidatus Nitrosotenuis uzonensis]
MSQNNYREMYVAEALEHVETINDTLLKLEEEPENREYLDLIFRSAHTVKGMSATMGYDDTRELCKNIENIFDNIRKGQDKLSPNLASALFKCIDLLRELIADEKKKVDLKPYLEMLEHPDDVQLNTVASTTAAKSPTIRVKMSDLDSLVNLVGELVISKMRLEQSLAKGGDDSRQVMIELDRLTTDLQYQSMKLRLVPIDQVFSRFTRLVRDTSASLGKRVNLVMDSSGIELDRTVLDAITDPLLHILRNCVDHGIEKPDERQASDKPPIGTIKLTAYGVGDHVGIKIEDDGRGINLDRLKAKAVEKGLISEEAAIKMSDDDAINLLGTPGLSTAKEVTDVSGRGVGMDVVITQVESVGGSVKITTREGKGTVIVLTIPLSVSIIGGLLINVAGDKYVLPLSSITTTVVVEPNQIKSIHGKEAIILRDQVVPLVRVAQLLGIEENKQQSDKITLVIVDKGGKPFGLVVDSYDKKQEIVIKRLGNEAHSSDLFTNATILGDGSVALILDPALLV